MNESDRLNPEELYKLFKEHDVQPVAGSFFSRRHVDRKEGCCGIGVYAYELLKEDEQEIDHSSVVKFCLGNLNGRVTNRYRDGFEPTFDNGFSLERCLNYIGCRVELTEQCRTELQWGHEDAKRLRELIEVEPELEIINEWDFRRQEEAE
jgi:hypothetical protein